MRRMAVAAVIGELLLASTALGADAPSIESPAEPTRKLVLEDAKRPGRKIDVAAYHGKPVVLRGMCPE